MILSTNLNNSIIINSPFCKQVAQESLFNAVNNGDEKLLRELIFTGVDLNCKNGDGNNLLILAVRKGKKEIVQQLIDAKIDLNIQDSRGLTPLAWSIMLSKTEIIEMLINAGADLNLKDSTGTPPLIWAARGGKKEIVSLFIKAKADLNIKDATNSTALQWAVKQERKEVIEMLRMSMLADIQKEDSNNDPTSINKSVLYKLKTTRKENYKEKFNLIANNNIKLLEKYKESTLVKAVGHATHQEGDIPNVIEDLEF